MTELNELPAEFILHCARQRERWLQYALEYTRNSAWWVEVSPLQAFIGEQVAMLASCGMRVPDPRNLPPIIYHDGNVAFPGETLQRAFEAGKEHFGREPDILLALLPDAGEACHAPSPPLRLKLCGSRRETVTISSRAIF